MWVSEKTFMQLIERVTKAEMKAEAALQALNVMRNGSVSVSADEKSGEKDVNANKLLDELLNGVPDEKLGRVKYTDGRE